MTIESAALYNWSRVSDTSLTKVSVIPGSDLQVALSIPFRDGTTGDLYTKTLTARVSNPGKTDMYFDLQACLQQMIATGTSATITYDEPSAQWRGSSVAAPISSLVP